MKIIIRYRLAAWCLLALVGCGAPYNNPYPAADSGKNILYTSFNERPKHLDPVQSYSSNEIVFNAQIYEPPLQYHYLKRPYQLIPSAAEKLPVAHYLDAHNQPLPDNARAADIAYTVYDITIRRGILYQPHPAFSRNTDGSLAYQHLSEKDLKDKHELRDFKQTGTREL